MEAPENPTHEERIEELAYYAWECMDMKDVEAYVIETLTIAYKKYPADFDAQWKNYKEITEEKKETN